jgi:23S rRNA (uracil1939-C5)-methyltransferase
VGTFGAFLADRFEQVDLVERDSRSIAIAAENVRGPRVRRFALSDDQWARSREGAERRYDFAVADPPRAGLSPALKAWLRERRPRVLAYVSCDPATQARDAKELAAAGYSLVSLGLFDFYPQTPHIESLAVFRCA